MAKKRIDRKFDVETGIMSFKELASDETLACDANKIFAFYCMTNRSEDQARRVG